MDTGMGTIKEQTIKEKVEELRESLRGLNLEIDSLTHRNNDCEASEKSVREMEDNIFDEILYVLTDCRGLAKEATDKVQIGIVNKVH